MDETSAETTHDLLLALAGRVDDDLLAWARELVAVGEGQHAIELLTATLAADRAELPEPVRAALVLTATSARTELDVAAALPQGRPENGTAHRFDAGEVDLVSDALRALPARLLSGCRVHLARRLTPAGSAPGPLPHPVVIVEVEPGARPRDVLTYQLTVALDRAGVRASVEVITADGDVPGYHAAALRCAVPARLGAADRQADRQQAGGQAADAAAHPGARPVPIDRPRSAVPAHDNVRPLVATGEPRPSELRRRDPRPHPGPSHQPTPAEMGLRGQLERPADQPALASLLGPEVREAEPRRDPSPPIGPERQWSQEWASGAWAMPTADAGDAGADLRPEGEQDHDAAGPQQVTAPPRPVRRPSARHRFATGTFERVHPDPARSNGDAGAEPDSGPAPAATTTGPIVTVPEAPASAAPGPDVPGSDATGPDATGPNAAETDPIRTDAPAPGGPALDDTALDGTGPDATGPDVTGPDMTGPVVTGPDATGTEATGPHAAVPPAQPAGSEQPADDAPDTRSRRSERLAAERPVSWPASADFVSGWAAPESAEAAPGRSTPDGPEPSLADLGLRPESVARLSTSDRELLQRLQAELLQGRGPRLSGSNGRADPPNMAG